MKHLHVSGIQVLCMTNLQPCPWLAPEIKTERYNEDVKL